MIFTISCDKVSLNPTCILCHAVVQDSGSMLLSYPLHLMYVMMMMMMMCVIFE